MPTNSIQPTAIQTRDDARKIERGLLSIEQAASAIDNHADNGFDMDQTLALAHLITREAGRLQDLFEPFAKAPSCIDTRALYSGIIDRTENEGLTDGQVAAELRGYLWDCEHILSAEDHEDDYRISATRSAKGVRAFLGERRFVEALMFPSGIDGIDQDEVTLLTLCIRATLHAIDGLTEIGADQAEELHELERRLKDALDEARYEGVQYENEQSAPQQEKGE